MFRRANSLLLAMLLLPGAACTKKGPPPTLSSETIPPEEVQRTTPEEFAQSLPRIGGVAGYVGSASCQECHKDQFSSWHRSYHRTMTQIASTNSVQADFHNVVLTNDTTRFKLSLQNGEYWVRMEHIGRHAEGGLDVRLGLLTGSHHMQVFWVPEGRGNLQLGFPFTWLIPEKRWVPRNSTFIRPPEFAHQSEPWNVLCTRCHTTGLEPHTDLRAGRIETRVAELGISCEACHGPGASHVEKRRLAAVASPDEARKLTPGEIVHPEKLDPVRASQVCGFCHSMKCIPPEENWREDGFDYRPGDDLEKTTPIIRPNRVNEIDRLAAYVKSNPDVLSGFFWPDGMVRVSGREYNGLIESPCYKGGKFSCISCHSLHDSEPDDQLASFAKADRGNGSCLQCHENFRDSTALASHTRHRAESSGSACQNCHMPHTTYGVLKAIRSHEISSPRIADELKSGRPNACNLCHLDKSLAWTADHLQDWYKQEKPALSETNISRIVELTLTGDAGQRAIAAWHLSWEPALEASGRDWQAPILGVLLDDPYGAVRCVAERSLSQFSAVPANYDFVIDPRARGAFRDIVWNAWVKSVKGEDRDYSRLLLHPDEATRQQVAFEQYAARRNDKPMRLRE